MFGLKKKKNRNGRPAPRNMGRRIADLFGRNGQAGEAFYEELEDLLVEADFGAASAVELVGELRGLQNSRKGSRDRNDILDSLRSLLKESLHTIDLTPAENGLSLYLVLGVNGVGKTTTIAKMAHRFGKQGVEGIVMAAADTFRAAAIDQLGIHADRVGARLVKQEHGSDPGAVIHDAVLSAKSRGDRLVLADTAGRMHNRANLVRELEKIHRIASERLGNDGVYKKILVIDATTGQNGMRQAETFHEAVDLDAVILTKYDSSAKGGLVAAICRKLNLPVAFLGRGEGMDDLIPFDADTYLDELLDGE